MSNPKINLILGSIRGIEIEMLDPFLFSLEKTGYKGDVCLFVSKVSNRTLNALKQRRVMIFPFRTINSHRVLIRQLYPSFVNAAMRSAKLLTFFLKAEKRIIIQVYIARSLINTFINHRFFLYYIFLSKNADKYSRVLLTDLRDVIFQRNPFDSDLGDGLCCFLEDKSMTLAACPYNSAWLLAAFGPNILTELGNNPISCAGVTIGDSQSIAKYLTTMVKILISLGAKALIPGVDQAVHNYIVHKKQVENLRLFENHSGPVLTMGYIPSNRIVFNSDGLVINDDGSVVHILHQYDRHPHIISHLMNRLVSNVQVRQATIS
jgi:hypothetical protein